MSLHSRFFNSPSRDLDQALGATTSSQSSRVSSTGKAEAISLAASGSAQAAHIAPADTSRTAGQKPLESVAADKTSQAHKAALGASEVGKASSASRLTVGPHIKLKGVEITDCDTLVVEGTVQASMDSRVMQIAEGGAFSGTAQIDEAEIRGEFDGQLLARHKLMLYATARVKGQIRYGKLVMEEGAQLSGDVAFGAAANAMNAANTAMPKTPSVTMANATLLKAA
jgi:cytoskeletal protein CcmA (bactofilin family)